jgi:quinol monooxygenase YgiN
MDNKIVRFTVDLAINDGKLGQFDSVAREMITGTLKEPGALAYEFFLSADRKRCRLLETYADANAVLAHMKGPVVQELVSKLLETSSISGFEVYGDPGAESGKMLTGLGAEIFPHWQGLGH